MDPDFAIVVQQGILGLFRFEPVRSGVDVIGPKKVAQTTAVANFVT
jgi:hypothetical protein